MQSDMRKRGLLALALLAAGVLGSAQAAPLVSGGIVSPLEADPAPGATLVAGGSLDTIFNAGPFHGHLLTNVYQNDGSSTGLTFTFQVTNDATSTQSIERLTSIDFTGWTTDVSYKDDPAVAADIAPLFTDRSPTSQIGWDLNPVAPGHASELLVVQTNAPTFVSSTASVLDGVGISGVATFGPAPEPGCIGLLMLSSVALLRRRSQS